MKRLFVALDLPSEVRCRLQLMAGGILGAKWVAPEKFHITLKFMGEVNEGVFMDATQALSEVRWDPFNIRLNGVDWFGDAKKPRLLYAGVEAGPDLNMLRERVDSTLARLGLAAENRKFTPHVTLAYLRGLPVHEVMAFIQSHNLFHTDPFEVSHFCLYSSQMKKGGSEYTVESAYGYDGGDPFDQDYSDHWSEEEDMIAQWSLGGMGHFTRPNPNMTSPCHVLEAIKSVDPAE